MAQFAAVVIRHRSQRHQRRKLQPRPWHRMDSQCPACRGQPCVQAQSSFASQPGAYQQAQLTPVQKEAQQLAARDRAVDYDSRFASNLVFTHSSEAQTPEQPARAASTASCLSPFLTLAASCCPEWRHNPVQGGGISLHRVAELSVLSTRSLNLSCFQAISGGWKADVGRRTRFR